MSPFSHLLRRTFSSVASQLSYRERDLLKVVDSFKRNSQSPDFRRKESHYVRTVQRLADANAFGSIKEILDEQKKFAEITRESFTARLIFLYGISGLFDHAHQLFDEMPELKCARTVKSFNALLKACVNSRKFDKVDGIFRELPEKLGIKPDIVSYNVVIKGFCEMGSFDSAALMLDEMEKEGVNPDLGIFNTLLDALFRTGRFVDGEKMFDLMGKYNVNPDIESYNKKLLGLVLQRVKNQEVIDFVVEIRNKGLNPNVFTFNILFKILCSDPKYVEEAKNWYNVMIETKCKPDFTICATLLPFACENDDFELAARLCRTLFYRGFWYQDVTLVQKVIDGLVKQSNEKEAAALVQLGRESKHSCYHSLRMPELETVS